MDGNKKTVMTDTASMTQRLSSLLLAIGVACGAFGAHGLKHSISPEYLTIWEKAVLYQLIHSLGALFLSSTDALKIPSSRLRTITWLMIGSTCIFSGSLYLLVLTNTKWLGAITPIGGAGFIISWLLLAISRRSS
jgi:uncharacterized membrane protein YgdD (TMEM256/DUF423 family)